MRHGTIDLFAALNLATGAVIHQLTARHRAVEFRKFLGLIDRTVPAELKVHVVLDNSSTHKTPAIGRWLVRHPRFEFHYTPTSSSWMNLVERWFAELTTKWLRRGTHRSVKELAASITAWAATGTKAQPPYVWHKTADEIFDSLAAYCQRISESAGLVVRDAVERWPGRYGAVSCFNTMPSTPSRRHASNKVGGVVVGERRDHRHR